MLQVSLYRYNPETDDAPFMQDFSVDTGGRDLMVLTFELIKAEHDGSVTYRRSCREGVCGSDGLNMNGKNGLACITPSETVKGEKLVLAVAGFARYPGLVDMSLFYAQYEKVQPYLQNPTPAPAIERLQTPEERAQLDGLYEAFMRLLLHKLPFFWWNPTASLGPLGCFKLSVSGRQRYGN